MRSILFFVMFLSLIPLIPVRAEQCVHSSVSGVCVDPSVTGEVEMTADGKLTHVRLYLHNNGKAERKLLTGRAGENVKGEMQAAYNLDAISDNTIGAGELAVPVLVFGNAQITAPRPVASGATFRNMAATSFTLKAGERRHYCSFSLPGIHAAGEFRYGTIAFPNADGTFVTIGIAKAAGAGGR